MRIPTGGRLTVGYLHNAVEELNSGLPRTNPDSSRVEDLNQGPPDFKSNALNHSVALPMHKSSLSVFLRPRETLKIQIII